MAIGLDVASTAYQPSGRIVGAGAPRDRSPCSPPLARRSPERRPRWPVLDAGRAVEDTCRRDSRAPSSPRDDHCSCRRRRLDRRAGAHHAGRAASRRACPPRRGVLALVQRPARRAPKPSPIGTRPHRRTLRADRGRPATARRCSASARRARRRRRAPRRPAPARACSCARRSRRRRRPPSSGAYAVRRRRRRPLRRPPPGHVHQGQDVMAAEGTPVVTPGRRRRPLARLPGLRRRPLRGRPRRRRPRLRVHALPGRLDPRREGPAGRRRPARSAASATPATPAARTCTSRSGPTAGTLEGLAPDRPAARPAGLGRSGLAARDGRG